MVVPTSQHTFQKNLAWSSLSPVGSSSFLPHLQGSSRFLAYVVQNTCMISHLLLLHSLCQVSVFVTVSPTSLLWIAVCISAGICVVLAQSRCSIDAAWVRLAWLEHPVLSSRSFQSTWKATSIYMKQPSNEEVRAKNTVQTAGVTGFQRRRLSAETGLDWVGLGSFSKYMESEMSTDYR